MFVDVVLDYFTVKEYKSECEKIANGTMLPVHWLPPEDFDLGMFRFSTSKADITCLLWPLGALSMFLPTIVMAFYIFCCGGYKG